MFFSKYKDKKDGAIRGFDLSSTSVKISVILITIICLLIIVACIFPVVWVFLSSFKELKEFRRMQTIFPAHIDFGKLKETWQVLKFHKYYLNSLISVAGSVVCAIFFNGLLAYGLAILKPKGYKIAFGLVMWSLLIPNIAGMVALFRNINAIGLNGSFIPLWLAFGANAFYVVLFSNFYKDIPKELLEAAKLDGCGVFKVFTSVVLPLSKPIIMVIAIMSLTAAWSEFLLPYLVLNGTGKETVMVKLFSYQDSPVDTLSILRAVLFSIIPPCIIFMVFQKQITDGAAAGAIKG